MQAALGVPSRQSPRSLPLQPTKRMRCEVLRYMQRPFFQNHAEPTQIGNLLEQAKYHMTQAVTSIQGRQSPAAAFWEYLVAYKIVVEVVPRHRDYIDRVETARGQLHRDFHQVLKVGLLLTVRL
jgi:hypothetical protein